MPMDEGTRVVMEGKGMLTRPGDFWGTSLYLVCETCNNGWMSQVQEQARPLLVPLFRGEWTGEISDEQRQRLATWCTVVTICLEYADESGRVVPDQDRLFVKQQLRPPPRWGVWLGHLSPTHQWGGFNHLSWSVSFDGIRLSHRSQATCWAMGRLFVQTYSWEGTEIVEREPEVVAELHGINVLWPPPGIARFGKPRDALYNSEADDIGRSLRPPNTPLPHPAAQALRQP